MNHYERLKVAPDAPPEVIRAAYRALAAKLHPDRKGGDAGPTEHAHEAMAALNASYLVLMDPAARAEYDRSLEAVSPPRVEPEPSGSFRTGFMNSRLWGGGGTAAGATASASAGAAAAAADDHNGQDTRVDIDWLLQTPDPQKPWFQDLRWLVGGGVLACAVLGGAVWWGLHEAERVAFDRSLAQRGQPADIDPAALDPAVKQALAGLPPDAQVSVGAATSGAAARPASAPELTAEQLSRLSNEELLALMPRLIEQQGGAGSTAAASAQSLLNPVGHSAHPLDGQPLGLKIASQLPAVTSPAANEP